MPPRSVERATANALFYGDNLDVLRDSIATEKRRFAVQISRGGFPAAFFVAAMKAIGRENVNLADL